MTFSRFHVAIGLAVGLAAQGHTLHAGAPAASRIAEIAALLAPEPGGVGPIANDRPAWDALARTAAFAAVVPAAEKQLGEPLPELTEELFLDYSRTGNRERAEAVIGQRQLRFCQLVLAECLEDKGRFLPEIEQIAIEFCEEKTWLYPAHDRGARNFRGEDVEIDLFSSRCAWNLATARYWLGDRLSTRTRDLIESELERRSFAPFEGAIRHNRPRMNWVGRASNWNAVCLAGTVGSALATIESPERRAFFIAAAEQTYPRFLKSFSSDGYSTEGVGYWKFGFGHFLMLSQMVNDATQGELDWLKHPQALAAASYPHRIRLNEHFYPPFSDCAIDARPGVAAVLLLDRRRGLTRRTAFDAEELKEIASDAQAILPTMAYVGWLEKGAANLVVETEESALRGWFPDHIVLVCRPRGGSPAALSVAINGGHNDEPHNHNDVGSYVVAIGDKMPLIDPGAEVYTARTFSPRRYDSQVINSFGHPVPRVAGKLQSTGRSARAELLEHKFTDDEDTLKLDLRSAYDVEELETLTREWRYRRTGSGSLRVTDTFKFSSPQQFEIALVTMEKWRSLDQTTLLLGESPNALRVKIATEPASLPIVVEPTLLEEDLGGAPQPTRLGLRFEEPLEEGWITLDITPAE